MPETPQQAPAKADLAALARHARGGLITVADATAALDTTPNLAAGRLARLTGQGWLTRVRRGLYYILPLETRSESHTTIEDPWVLGSILYGPCYIGGWSAAEHWGLTEQLFRSTFIATSAHIRSRDERFLGVEFHLVRIHADRLGNVGTVWRGTERVAVSAPERTIVDALRDPRWAGGVRHLIDILLRYREGAARGPARLVEELSRSGNGAAAKRLGFLLERLWRDSDTSLDQLLAMKTAGVIKLDPSIRTRGRLNKRWGLWANVTLPGVAEP